MVFRTGFFPKTGPYCIFFVLLHVIQVCFADRKKRELYRGDIVLVTSSLHCGSLKRKETNRYL